MNKSTERDSLVTRTRSTLQANSTQVCMKWQGEQGDRRRTRTRRSQEPDFGPKRTSESVSCAELNSVIWAQDLPRYVLYAKEVYDIVERPFVFLQSRNYDIICVLATFVKEDENSCRVRIHETKHDV